MTYRETLPASVKQQVVEDAKKQSLLKNTKRTRTVTALPSSLAPELHDLAVKAVGIASLGALTITNTMTPVDIGDGQPNALSVANQAYGLEMTVPEPASVEEVEYEIQWFVDGRADAVHSEFIDMSPGNPWPASFFITTGWYTSSHGQHFITYTLIDQSTGNDESSAPTFYWVDTRNPVLGSQRPPALIPPADLPAPNTVTVEYLDANGGIELQAPALIDWKIGDTFSVFVGRTELLKDEPITSMPPFAFTLDDVSIKALGQGVKDFTFIAKDRAGNETNESQILGLDIVLTSAPGPLPAPRVPESPVSRADVVDGVLVFVDPYPNALSGDRIEVNWNGTLLDEIEFPADQVVVPYITVAVYGEQYTAKVSYSVRRGHTISPPSAELDVPVDITVIGPPNPDFPPSLVNPDLDLPSLLITGGTANTITPAEKGQSATVTVTLYPGAVVGHGVQAFYNDVTTPVEARRAIVQQEIDDNEMTFTLSSTLIDTVGNGQIPLFYRIYEDLTVENYQQSADQPVAVTVGDLANLPVASFPQQVTTIRPPIINCSVVENPITRGNVIVRMGFPQFDQGDQLTIHWVMHNQRGTLPGGVYTPPNAPVEATRRSFQHEVTLQEASNNVVNFTVEWGSPHLADVVDGAIEVYWQIEKAGNVRGTSDSSYVNFSRRKPGNVICSPVGS